MKRILALLLLPLLNTWQISAQDPELNSWLLNDAGTTYNGILVDVESIHYNDTYVWITSNGIPNYYLDNQSVFDAIEQDFVLRVVRNPVEETGTNRVRSAGNISYCIDGSVIYAPGDGMSYNDMDIWNQIAYFFERLDFDDFNGHSTPPGVYHHHVDNIGVHGSSATEHSPIIAFAPDGFPVYGPYGYADPLDVNSGIQRMATSFQKRNITERTTLPNGTALSEAEYGPSLAEEELGSYIEDYEFIAASGDLDEHNGRYCITPEYPNGIYAYFTTIDAQGDPEYPFFIGDTYYGDIPAGQFGPNSTSQTIAEDAVEYTSPLPLQLLGFTASATQKDVVVRWSTIQEQSLQGFEIQRLHGSYLWQTIGRKEAVGTTSNIQAYEFTDPKPVEGLSYYRLKMIDNDRSVAYSPAVSLNFQPSTTILPIDIKIYPNPVQYILQVENVRGNIRIFTPPGQLLIETMTKTYDNHSHTHPTSIDIYELPTGLYFLETQNVDGQSVGVPFFKN